MITAKALPPTKVGVAPGTTTFTLGDAPGTCPTPAASRVQAWRLFNSGIIRDAIDRGRVAVRALSPYATLEKLQGVLGKARRPGVWSVPARTNLGYILDTGPTEGKPYAEALMALKSTNSPYCGTYDKQYHTRATPGLYYDTRLGGALGRIPNDLQQSRVWGFTPVMSSWLPFQQGAWAPGPWVPPNGTWTPEGLRPVGPPLHGLAGPVGEDVTTATSPVPYNTGEAAVAELKRHQDRVFALSVVSTMAIASTAAINIIKHLQEQRKTRRKSEQMSPASPTAPIAGARRRRRQPRGRR